jgi:predicted AAA+ superfamily ATPase
MWTAVASSRGDGTTTPSSCLFVDALRQRVGGLVVLANIASDLQVAPTTLKRWLEVLERMYLLFVVPPLTNPGTRLG